MDDFQSVEVIWVNKHAKAAVLFLAGTVIPAASAAGGLERLEYRQILMGVPVRVSVYARKKEPANAAVHAAFDRIRQLNLIFSDYDDDSEISRLARGYTPGKPVPISAELATVLAASLDVSRRSEGAFDVTVAPLVGLWRASRRTKRLPTAGELASARKRVGYQSVHLDIEHRTVTLDKPGMRFDFGGIVKGYAADEAPRRPQDARLQPGFGGDFRGTFPSAIRLPENRAGRSASPGSSRRAKNQNSSSGSQTRPFRPPAMRFNSSRSPESATRTWSIPKPAWESRGA